MRFEILFTLFLVAQIAVGDVIIPPPGLESGDEYRLAFVTSGVRRATSTDIEFYNDFVNLEASRANSIISALDIEWKAIVSTDEVDARDNTNTNWLETGDVGVPIYRVDGERVASDYTQFWTIDFTEDVAVLNITPSGGQVFPDPLSRLGIPEVFTGTDFTGRAAFSNAFQESRAVGNSRVMIGDASSATFRFWGAEVASGDSFSRHIYAISEVLTVVPEPTGACLILFVVLGLAYRNRQG